MQPEGLMCCYYKRDFAIFVIIFRAVYIDNSEMKNMRPFPMLGRIAWFLKENPHVEVECDRAISFLLGEIYSLNQRQHHLKHFSPYKRFIICNVSPCLLYLKIYRLKTLTLK